MSGNLIVTIGRENGSGGLAVGQKLAQRLGVKCYDKEILSEASKNSGFAEQIFHEYDETSQKNMLFAWTASSGTFGYGMPLATQVYLEQFKAIREIASREPCVFVGRCSDYVLKDMGYDLVNVFVHASIEARIKVVCERENVDETKARAMIIKTDKDRASYYNYYTDQKWGRIENYHLVVDSSLISIDDVVELITSYINIRKKNETVK